MGVLFGIDDNYLFGAGGAAAAAAAAAYPRYANDPSTWEVDNLGHRFNPQTEQWENLDGTPYDPSWNQPKPTGIGAGAASIFRPAEQPLLSSSPPDNIGIGAGAASLFHPVEQPPLPPSQAQEFRYSGGGPPSPPDITTWDGSVASHDPQTQAAYTEWFKQPRGFEDYQKGLGPDTTYGRIERAKELLDVYKSQLDPFAWGGGIGKGPGFMEQLRTASTSLLPESVLNKIPDQIVPDVISNNLPGWGSKLSDIINSVSPRNTVAGMTSMMGLSTSLMGGGGLANNFMRNTLGLAGAEAAGHALDNVPDPAINVTRLVLPALVYALTRNAKLTAATGALGALPPDQYRGALSMLLGGSAGYKSPEIAVAAGRAGTAAVKAVPSIARTVGEGLGPTLRTAGQGLRAGVLAPAGVFIGSIPGMLPDDAARVARAAARGADLSLEDSVSSLRTWVEQNATLKPAQAEAISAGRGEQFAGLNAADEAARLAGLTGRARAEAAGKGMALPGGRISTTRPEPIPNEAFPALHEYNQEALRMGQASEVDVLHTKRALIMLEDENRAFNSDLLAASRVLPREVTAGLYARAGIKPPTAAADLEDVLAASLAEVKPKTLSAKSVSPELDAAITAADQKARVSPREFVSKNPALYEQPTRPLPGMEGWGSRATHEGTPVPGRQGMEPLMGGESATELHFPEKADPAQIASRVDKFGHNQEQIAQERFWTWIERESKKTERQAGAEALAPDIAKSAEPVPTVPREPGPGATPEQVAAWDKWKAEHPEYALEFPAKPITLSPEEAARAADRPGPSSPIDLKKKIQATKKDLASAQIAAARAESIATKQFRPEPPQPISKAVLNSSREGGEEWKRFITALREHDPKLAIQWEEWRSADARFRELLTNADPSLAIEAGLAREKADNLLSDLFDQSVDYISPKRRFNNIREMGTRDALDLLSLPRSMEATGDLPPIFRQGAVLSIGHPKEAVKAFIKGIETMNPFGGKGDILANKFAETRAANEYAPLRKLANVFESPLPKKMSAVPFAKREEGWGNTILNKIPVHSAAQRGYITFLNELRSNVFDIFAKAHLTDPNGADKIKKMGTFIDHATGRGTGKGVEDAAAVLSSVFFSTHMHVSRIQLLLHDPFMMLGDKDLAIEYLRTVGAFYGAGISGLALVSMLDKFGLIDASVEYDPRSTDFGKIKIGNTRIDYWGGYQQIARYTAQAIMGEKLTEGGNLVDKNRLDTVLTFGRSKLAPIPGLATDLLQGETMYGGELQPTQSTALAQAFNRLTPLAWQDIIQGYQENGPEGLLLGLTSLLGAGAQSYESDTAASIRKYEETTGNKWGDVPAAEKQWKIDNPEPFNFDSPANTIRNEFSAQLRANDTKAMDGEETLAEWRENRKMAKKGERDAIGALYANFDPREATSEQGKLIASYYKMFEDATLPGGLRELDIDKLDKLQGEWLVANGEAGLKIVQDYAKVGASPIEKKYQDDLAQKARDGYWDMPRYTGMVSGLKDDEIDALHSEVERQRTLARDNKYDQSGLGDMEFANAAYVVLSKMGKSVEEIIDVANSGSEKYAAPRAWTYKHEHPELFYWDSSNMKWEDVA